MSTADELKKLHDLLLAGALTTAEYEQAKARLLLASPTGGDESLLKRLRRSSDDQWIAGVCGGIARATDVETWIWRLLFVLGAFAGGATIVLYLILWIFMPRDNA
jgi:phage shock protein C